MNKDFLCSLSGGRSLHHHMPPQMVCGVGRTLDHSHNELSTFRFTSETVPVDSLTRLTAFLITQPSYLDIYNVNLTVLPANRIILRRELKYMFPGESIAATSYRISALQILEAGTDVTSDSRSTVSQENWIPVGASETMEIIGASTGGIKIENHFHEWLMKQRNITI
ncbi:hypothetical protein TcWFU_007296 [Taenia crassiceps]|uniref:Uncharacterized protein n=1 Tax=Taenia crassiceps TaxID=6207 RepID=A0ABR4Q6G7_9CEST